MNNVIIFSILVLSIGLVSSNNIVFAQIPKVQLSESEIDEYGRDSNGDKLDYNDCPNYNDGIDPKDYDELTLDELGDITDKVDARIKVLELIQVTGTTPPEAITEYTDELNCLAAIRAIENQAQEKITTEVSGFIKDLQELSDLYSDQIEVNERFESLQEKYGE